MTARRRGKLSALIWALATLAGLLPAAPRVAWAASDPSLQVIREVNTVGGGDAPTLTAQLSGAAGSPTQIDFEVLDGPGDQPFGDGDGGASPDETCSIASGATSCVVAIRGTQEGTSRVRAWIHGTTPDTEEGRLSNGGSVGLLDAGVDCQTGDDELLQDTCHGGAAVQPGNQTEPDATDLVQIAWTSFTDAKLNCDDANPADGTDVEYNNAAADDRSEQYTCSLTTLAGQPVTNAFIDGERTAGSAALESPNGAKADSADLNDFCHIQGGQCTGTVKVTNTGDATLCFWAEPGNPNDAATGEDNAYNTTDNTDGKGCADELVDETEGNDITDAVLLDTDNPRASGIDARPEVQTGSSGEQFILSAVVYDQFGRVFTGDSTDTEVSGELFDGSPLDEDGNTPSSPDFACHTGTVGGCSTTMPAQVPLGTNLACLWIGDTPASNRFIGDNLDGSCDDEVPTDPTVDDGTPAPVGDGRDIVRFTVQSRPAILAVSPDAKRQETTDVLAVTGANFVDGARLTVSGQGVKVGPTSYVSGSRLEADLGIAPDAPAGNRDVTVTNPDGGTTTCAGCFHVVGQGYWLVASDGGIFGFGDAGFSGSAGDRPLNKPIVGMAATPTGKGYWLAASDGGVFNFGDAPFLGSAGNLNLNKPVVGVAALPSGKGYWLVGSDGGIFAFGEAKFYGSTGRLPLSKPIVGISASPTGRGYWLVGSDGGIFAFGDAKYYGSAGDLRLNRPIAAMAATSTGKGYWLAGVDGGIFAYGDATFYGGTGDIKLNRPIVSMVTTPFVKGYWLVASDGGIFNFGDAHFFGSTGDLRLNQPIVGIARR
jgi:hypothetical protein